jgi:hypothetical protein
VHKLLVFVIVSFVGLAACNNKKPEEGKEPLQPAAAPVPAPAGGTPAPSAAAASPASASAVTPSAAPAGGATAPSPVACATAATPACDAGQVDGCTGGLTAVHLCVARDAKAGSPCAQGAALACPTGQIDACTYTPPYASNHICVVVPKPTP